MADEVLRRSHFHSKASLFFGVVRAPHQRGLEALGLLACQEIARATLSQPLDSCLIDFLIIEGFDYRQGLA